MSCNLRSNSDLWFDSKKITTVKKIANFRLWFEKRFGANFFEFTCPRSFGPKFHNVVGVAIDWCLHSKRYKKHFSRFDTC